MMRTVTRTVLVVVTFLSASAALPAAGPVARWAGPVGGRPQQT